MITRVYAKNFRSLAKVDVNLNKLTVLVGPNSCGKSNFLDVLRFFSDALRKGLQPAIDDDRQGIKTIRRWSPSRPYDIELEIEIEDNIKKIAFDKKSQKILDHKIFGTYRIEIKSARSVESDTYGITTYQVKKEKCEIYENSKRHAFQIVNGKFVEKPKGIAGSVPEPSLTNLLLPLLSYFRPFSLIYRPLMRMFFYNIYPNIIKTPREPGAEYPLDSHGRNIASVLRRLQREKSPWLEDIKEVLSNVVSDLSDFQVTPVGGFLTLKFKHKSDKNKPHYFEATQESDGTLRILGILVSLFQDPPPFLLAIEEPEITVHPGVLGILADLIKEASKERSQVLVTTHSPDLISKFDADDLRIVEWDIKDGTTIGPVDESQRDVINEKLFSGGDLLRIEGLRSSKSKNVSA
jgi:predicted ATPase